ncbi:MAG: DUF6870 family protein [Faecalispora jeddahensis]|uniref:DUF6870 family protein n=1 Tax=Faecalispora jeddahensis TaxID=1414721 RepID=UPI0039918F5C
MLDVKGFTFDSTVPQEQRAARITAAVKNPSCFRVGDMDRKPECPEDTQPFRTPLSPS